MKALVVCTGGGIGDVLLATPVMRALAQRYDEVVALTAARHRDVLATQPMLAAVWTDEGAFAAQAARIATYGFDAAVVTWATLRSAALPFVGRVPVRVGQARRTYSRLFTERVVVRSELGDHATHWTQILLDFARALECDVADATPAFPVTGADRAAAAALLASLGVGDEAFAVLHPTRGIAAARARWPTASLGRLGRELAEATGVRVLVSGAPADADIAARVAREAGALSIAGRTSLGVYAALAERARFVTAMDSGPMHVAAAVGAPTVGIFALASDEPRRWAPLGPRTAIVTGSYPCPPAHRKETCPDFACVAALDTGSVVAAVRGLLGGETEIRS